MTFNEKISIDGIGGHINTNPKKSYKTKAVKSLFTGKIYQSPNTKIMTPSELIQLLESNNIATDIESLCRALCDRYESIVIERAKRTWRVYIEGNSTLDVVGYEIYDTLINLMVLLVLEGIKTIEDYINNNKLN